MVRARFLPRQNYVSPGAPMARSNEARTADRRFLYYTDKGGISMGFFSSAVETLQTLVIALGAGLAVWGVINLLEGYGADNPAANAHVS